jgi:AraC-like DNA-binding protein
VPKTIRRALYRKLRELPEMAGFQRDFLQLSGMKLAFLDELGLGDDLNHAQSPLCQDLQSSEPGRSLCSRSRHALLSGSRNQPCDMVCDVGLSEFVVPLKIGGIHAGYFVFGGLRATPPRPHALHKAAHLLQKYGIPLDASRLEKAYLGTHEMALPKLEAFQRLVQLFAHHIALKLTDQLAQPEASMPPTVLKACRFIRTHALLENINLAAVAKHCGVSTGHLSRLFHHSTSLTFREYLAQVRIEHARDLLLRSGKNVTEVAFDSGFQSISQFHRVFRKAFGMSPGRLRTKHGAPSHSPPS